MVRISLGQDVAKDLCDAMGLGHLAITNLTIDIPVNEPVRATVDFLIDQKHLSVVTRYFKAGQWLTPEEAAKDESS